MRQKCIWNERERIMTDKIIVNGQFEKSYTSKYVAFIWCLMHGYVWHGRDGLWIKDNVKIIEE